MKDGRVVETGTVFDIFANPKEQITREFVENTSNMSRIYELVETKSPVVEVKTGRGYFAFQISGAKCVGSPCFTVIKKI